MARLALAASCAAALGAGAAQAQAPPAWPVNGASARRTYRGGFAGPAAATGVAFSVPLGNASWMPSSPVVDGAGTSYLSMQSLLPNGGGHGYANAQYAAVQAVSASGALLWTNAGLGCDTVHFPYCTVSSVAAPPASPTPPAPP